MAFQLDYSAIGNGECCDKCGVRDQQPAFFFYQSSREGRNLIWIHARCLERAMQSAKKRAEKAISAQSAVQP